MRAASLAAVLLTAVGALTGCDLMPGASSAVARDVDGSFELVLRVGATRYPANAPIDASAALWYQGQEAAIDLVGSGSGLISFSAKQLDGRFEFGGAQTADCRPYRLDRGRPLEVPYKKSGGWSADDPDAAFYIAFFNDPKLRLPRGRWQISATAGFTVDECGGVGHALDAQVTIVVE